MLVERLHESVPLTQFVNRLRRYLAIAGLVHFAQFCNQLTKFCALGFDFIHCVNFRLAQFAVALDFSVLVFHGMFFQLDVHY